MGLRKNSRMSARPLSAVIARPTATMSATAAFGFRVDLLLRPLLRRVEFATPVRRADHIEAPLQHRISVVPSPEGEGGLFPQ